MALVGFAFTACDDDDTPAAKAVLCSVFQLNYEATDPQSQEIKVVSDGEWHLESCSDWVSISPETGNGTTFVTVTVTPNYENGVMQLPRRGEFTLKGGLKMSEAQVVILQAGDDYLGVASYSIAELAITPDESPVIMPDLTVAAELNNSLILTDGNMFLYADSKPEGAVKGAKGTFKGYKASDVIGAPYLQCQVFELKDNVTVTDPEPEVITSFKDYQADGIRYVQIEGGHIDSGRLYIEEEPEAAIFVDTTSDFDLNAMQNKVVTVKGFYLGTQGSNVRVAGTEVEVLGNYQTVYFREDFEWLEPWSSQKPAGQTVETNDPDATAQQLGTNKYTVDGKDVTTYQALLAQGYEFPITCHANRSPRKPEAQIYLQRNYLKFGLTGYYSGLTLKPIETIPAGEHVMMSFDWCSQRQGSGKWDPTKLVIVVKNGEEEVQFEVPEHDLVDGGAYHWINARIDLGTVLIDKDTKITIRNSDDQWPGDSNGALRWFIDNIKIVAAE